MLKIRFDLLICVTLTLLVHTLIQFILAQYQGVPSLHHHRQHIFLSLNVFNRKKYGSIYKKMSPFLLLRSILWLLVSLFNSFHSLFSYFIFFVVRCSLSMQIYFQSPLTHLWSCWAAQASIFIARRRHFRIAATSHKYLDWIKIILKMKACRYENLHNIY